MADYRGGPADAIAKGMMDLGAGLSNLAETRIQIERERAETEATEATTRYAQEAGDIQSAPETGYLNTRGKLAIDGLEPAMQALKDRAKAIEDGLSSAQAKKLFRQSADARLANMSVVINRHAAVQSMAWQDEADDDAASQSLADAVNMYTDPDQAEAYLVTAASILQKKGERAGAPAASVAADIQKRLSETRTLMIARMAKVDPAGAERYRQRVEKMLFGSDTLRATEAVRIEQERNEAEARRIAAEQRAEQARQVALKREDLATRKAQLETGAGTPADWMELATEQRAIGDTSGAAQSEARANETRASETYRGATLPQIDQRIAQLEAAKKGKAGLSPAQASELNGLRSRREQTASRLNQPGGALLQDEYATGGVLASLNHRDPETYVQRGRAAVAAAQRQGGAIEPLVGEEIRVLNANMEGDSNSRLKVLRSLALFRDPRVIRGAARQLTSESDGDFRIAATLITTNERTATEILRGRDALAANGKVYQPDIADAGFNQHVASALAGMPPDYVRDVKAAAKAIYAERARVSGQASWNSDLWKDAINSALGGDSKGGRTYGGVAKINGAPVSLPPGWTSEGIELRIADMNGDDMGRARVGKPGVWPDGSRLYSGQLRAMVPVLLGGTVYGFRQRNSNRLLSAQDGQPYKLDVAKLPWKRR
ncbi:hypothetical protein [Sphingomonas turrisvirgatae]|uniref:Uncharacterized protein n=1 Tax=Sphingomonas turrisvirgatae TaxID=1888892 RepID=A0A1E3LZZ6_9SPHN|nr:hypothetical protein [Sphingomonas turrisvirgatae]ODP39362.1 hypothetical protein BFL28_11175 [Sphingomonas turrisvirgatae]